MTTMDPEASKRWNAWAKDVADRRIKAMSKAILGVVAEALAHRDKRMAALEQRIADMEAAR